MNKKIRKGEVFLFFWFFKLIRDSSLWRSNFIPSVRDSIVIIGSRSITYTFDSHFTYKHWVRVLSKICILAFLRIIPILFVGSQSVSIEVRITSLVFGKDHANGKEVMSVIDI